MLEINLAPTVLVEFISHPVVPLLAHRGEGEVVGGELEPEMSSYSH